MSGYSEKMADTDVVPRQYEDENQLQDFFKFVREYFEIDQKWGEIKEFGAEHPVISLFLVVTMASCSIPITLFTIFVVGSVVVSVTGFLFFEGTIIAVASLALGGVLLFAIFIAAGFSIFLVAGYQAVTFAGNLLRNANIYVPAMPFGGSSTVASEHPPKKD